MLSWLLAIHREKFLAVVFYYVNEVGVVAGQVVSTNYKVSPISAGGLEIRLLLTFSVEQKRNPEIFISKWKSLSLFYHKKYFW